MGKKISILMATVLATLVVGCASNVKQLGSIGDTKFFRVKNSTFAGPNFSALVVQRGDAQPEVNQVFGGPGLGPTVISAVGQVGASAILGRSFPKNVGDNISTSGGDVTANGGSASNEANSSSTASSTAISSSRTTAQTINQNNNSNVNTTSSGKSHPGSPGNGGTPGNGGQNGGNPHNP